jgi:hypothetical protein
MSTDLLNLLVLVPTAAVVVALFMVMWHERSSSRQASVALVSGGVLGAWAMITAVLASRGFFLPPDAQRAPPVGIYLAVVLVCLAVSLTASGTLRSLLTNQKNLIRLNVWRLEGIVFLLLMADGQMPAVWALPAGIGDIVVGAMAFWVASRVGTPNGIRWAVIFNLFGLADLVVAVGLGIMTSPGPAQLVRTTPTSELVTHFPLVLVPTFLVPLAFTLHVISLWQLSGARWAPRVGAPARSLER